jgi:predicted lipoprotein with Yx(FWY)xxD motif
VALIAGGALAACGGSSSSSNAASGQSSSSTAQSSAPAGASPYGASASSSSATTAKSVVITTKHSKLGTILAVGPKRLTVYLFEADKGPQSACSGACASAWPPVLGQPKASGSAASSDLGTIKRSDGSTQVTYKGHPLYTFVKDEDNGDAYGQGTKAFGAEWYVLTPGGNKVDKS